LRALFLDNNSAVAAAAAADDDDDDDDADGMVDMFAVRRHSTTSVPVGWLMT